MRSEDEDDGDAAQERVDALEHARAVGVEFLLSAWERLRADRIAPRPRHQPRMAVGSDWFWEGGSGWPQAGELERSLMAAFPERFAETDPPNTREFASMYLPRLVEDAVALETQMPLAAACARAVDDVLRFLSSESHEVVAQRIVSHIGATGSAVLGGTGVEIAPLETRGWLRVGQVFGIAAVEGEEVFLHSEHPHVLLTARATYRPGDDWSERFEEASAKLDHAVALLRLFRRTSARNVVEYQGFVESGAYAGRLSRAWPGDVTAALAFAGTEFAVSLDESALVQFTEFERLYGDILDVAVADWHRRGLAVAGMQVGLTQFAASFSYASWMVQVPRLITVVEAWLLPEEATEAVTARLRSRLCLLLQEDAASCERLFSDVSKLYELRSRMEHGADVRAKKVRQHMRGASGVDGELHGLIEATAIERLRELARKAICLRLLLASGGEPLWSITDQESVEVRVLEDGFRRAARERLREQSDRLGLGLFDAPATA